MSQRQPRYLAASLLAAALLLLLPISISATTVVRLDLADLVASSTYIGEVRVESTETFKRDGTIYTRVQLQNQRAWTESIEAESLTLELPGGRHGEITTRVSGVPHFAPGQRAVVFLQRTSTPAADSPKFAVTGLSQGVFKVALGPDGTTKYVIPRVGDMNLIEVQRRDARGRPTNMASVPAAELHRQTHRLDDFRQSVIEIIRANQSDEPDETQQPAPEEQQ